MRAPAAGWLRVRVQGTRIPIKEFAVDGVEQDTLRDPGAASLQVEFKEGETKILSLQIDGPATVGYEWIAATPAN